MFHNPDTHIQLFANAHQPSHDEQINDELDEEPTLLPPPNNQVVAQPPHDFIHLDVNLSKSTCVCFISHWGQPVTCSHPASV